MRSFAAPIQEYIQEYIRVIARGYFPEPEPESKVKIVGVAAISFVAGAVFHACLQKHLLKHMNTDNPLVTENNLFNRGFSECDLINKLIVRFSFLNRFYKKGVDSNQSLDNFVQVYSGQRGDSLEQGVLGDLSAYSETAREDNLYSLDLSPGRLHERDSKSSRSSNNSIRVPSSQDGSVFKRGFRGDSPVSYSGTARGGNSPPLDLFAGRINESGSKSSRITHSFVPGFPGRVLEERSLQRDLFAPFSETESGPVERSSTQEGGVVLSRVNSFFSDDSSGSFWDALESNEFKRMNPASLPSSTNSRLEKR